MGGGIKRLTGGYISESNRKYLFTLEDRLKSLYRIDAKVVRTNNRIPTILVTLFIEDKDLLMLKMTGEYNSLMKYIEDNTPTAYQVHVNYLPPDKKPFQNLI